MFWKTGDMGCRRPAFLLPGTGVFFPQAFHIILTDKEEEMEKHYCVIGDPVVHSLSPDIYNCLFRLYGLSDCNYTKERVTRESLPAFIAACRERHICGFNVTMPLKEAVLPYLTYKDPAAAFGVNTVVAEPETGLAGWSTDAAGFEKSLALHHRSFQNADVVFIGSGGAARTLIHSALSKADRIVICNRTPARAAVFDGHPDVTVISFQELASCLESCDLLIQATPLGMHGSGSDYRDLGFLHALPKDALVADLIYNPAETAFLRAARESGHETMNGLGMLIWQAFYAFSHFTPILPDETAYKEIEALLTS